jgi:2-polyprenyl-6-methoxyphenol hydroxylase-like FAD-dependent oxidoreductase
LFRNCTFIPKNIIKKINIIGSGIAGLAAAIRLSKKGYQITIFEKNNYLNELHPPYNLTPLPPIPT